MVLFSPLTAWVIDVMTAVMEKPGGDAIAAGNETETIMIELTGDSELATTEIENETGIGVIGTEIDAEMMTGVRTESQGIVTTTTKIWTSMKKVLSFLFVLFLASSL